MSHAHRTMLIHYRCSTHVCVHVYTRVTRPRGTLYAGPFIWPLYTKIVSASARGPASICHGDATHRYLLGARRVHGASSSIAVESPHPDPTSTTDHDSGVLPLFRETHREILQRIIRETQDRPGNLPCN